MNYNSQDVPCDVDEFILILTVLAHLKAIRKMTVMEIILRDTCKLRSEIKRSKICGAPSLEFNERKCLERVTSNFRSKNCKLSNASIFKITQMHQSKKGPIVKRSGEAVATRAKSLNQKSPAKMANAEAKCLRPRTRWWRGHRALDVGRLREYSFLVRTVR